MNFLFQVHPFQITLPPKLQLKMDLEIKPCRMLSAQTHLTSWSALDCPGCCTQVLELIFNRTQDLQTMVLSHQLPFWHLFCSSLYASCFKPILSFTSGTGPYLLFFTPDISLIRLVKYFCDEKWCSSCLAILGGLSQSSILRSSIWT